MKNNNKQKKHLLMAAMIPFFATACVNSIQEEEIELTPGQIPIKISTNIRCTPTRAIDNKFEIDDFIGVFVLEESKSLDKSRYIDNMRFTCTSTGLIPDQEVFYPLGENKCNFIGYYPYQENAIAANESRMNMEIKANQSLPSEYSISDFMTAKTTGVNASNKSVKLDFEHKLCQLNIVLQIAEYDDIDEAKKNAAVFINKACTKATYHFDSDEFSSHSAPQKITPNGEWSINKEKRELAGKKALLIPQQTNNYEISLHINGNTFSAPLPDDLVLASNKSSKVILSYDSRVGIGILESSIGQWDDGNSKEVALQQKNRAIDIDALDFDRTGVYQIKSESNSLIAEVCKEYLLNNNIDKQAIVLYPAVTKSQGTVLQLLDTSENLHGGSVTWSIDSNSFAYTPGSSAPITTIYMNSEQKIVFSKPTDPQLIEATESILNDKRGTETQSYPIIKIGTQYWMGGNLNATKYNDGSVITKITDMTKTTAGYYLNATNKFYNQAAVIKGTLAPKGWKIPNNTEWEQLKTYLKNTATVLKGGAWTSASDTDSPTNKTGFNAQPVGIFGEKGNSSSGYAFNHEITIYWNMANSQTSIFERAINIMYTQNVIGKAEYSKYNGYSIRCIKE